MKTKVNKIAKTIAVGIFFMALFFNVKVSLEDPFLTISSDVFAQTSSPGGGENCETGGLPNVNCPYWIVTITYKWTGPETSCTTGGNFTCN